MTTFRRRLSDLLGLTVPEPEPRYAAAHYPCPTIRALDAGGVS